MDIIEKGGSYYSYKGESLAQGRENCKEALRQNPALMREIENLVREASGLPTLAPIEGTVVLGGNLGKNLEDPDYADDQEDTEDVGDE